MLRTSYFLDIQKKKKNAYSTQKHTFPFTLVSISHIKIMLSKQNFVANTTFLKSIQLFKIKTTSTSK